MGVFPDVLCGGNDRALQFAKDVLNEIMDIFPSPYIHIGGDECPKVRWENALHVKLNSGTGFERYTKTQQGESITDLFHVRGRQSY